MDGEDKAVFVLIAAVGASSQSTSCRSGAALTIVSCSGHVVDNDSDDDDDMVVATVISMMTDRVTSCEQGVDLDAKSCILKLVQPMVVFHCLHDTFYSRLRLRKCVLSVV